MICLLDITVTFKLKTHEHSTQLIKYLRCIRCTLIDWSRLEHCINNHIVPYYVWQNTTDGQQILPVHIKVKLLKINLIK